jgi:glutamate formiminotransferase/formiminotetrahydrofolate cyclodeaminase
MGREFRASFFVECGIKIHLKYFKEVTDMTCDKKYVLAVPNFSEGRNFEVIEAAAAAVESVESVRIISVEPEANFNRTVLTFICEPGFYKEAILKLAEVVFQHINMERQKGDHPRIGAFDTAPVFPLKNVELEEARLLAEEVGAALFSTFKVPVFYSGLNARTDYKKSNTNIRKGQYEGLKALLETPEHQDLELRRPDLSVDGKLDSKMGGITVSSDKEGLTAFNVFIDTEDTSIANEIAKVVKHPETGWSSIKGIGFKDVKHEGTAISMNVFDAASTSLAMLKDFVSHEAEIRGAKVIGTQIVGPVKLKYLLDSAKLLGYAGDETDFDSIIACLKAQLKLEGFHKMSIIELHLL